MSPGPSSPKIRPWPFREGAEAVGRVIRGILGSSAWRIFSHHQTLRTASAMAFDFFLALVPMLAFGGYAVIRLLHADPAALAQSSALLDLTPREMQVLVERHFRTFSDGDLAPLAVLGSWWISSEAFHTMIRLFEEIFGNKRRGFVEARLWALGLALLFVGGLGLIALLGFAVGSAGTDLARSLVGEFLASGLLRMGLGLVFLGVSTAFLSLIYFVSMGRRASRHRAIFPGALAASLLGASASAGLGYYVAHATRLAFLYGSLLAVVVLMLWLWLWSHALILGAIVNATIENHRAPSESEGVEVDDPARPPEESTEP